MLELRQYQQRSLGQLEAYLSKVGQLGADTAFYSIVRRVYRAVPQLPGLPYVCLRVPTGGGKTLMACHALGITAKEYLQVERAVCLWLVPSNAIREQTIKALRDRKHPYREAIDAQFAGNVRVMDLSEALYVQRSDLEGDTCIIVSTLAALRVEDTEGRKIYESAGALQHHFSGLPAALEAKLERQNGSIPYSLANVLRLHGPVVIMDEAHNARTKLSFETLARFSPSCIIEFTATPQLEHDPPKGFFASNVLHHVSAAELKTEEMVKLPIKLKTRSDWRETIGDALATQRSLEAVALEEEKATGEYLRPIVLFQAQPHKEGRETLNVEVVKKSLLEDFKIPEDQIAVATGGTREIEGVDLFARDCQIRFIITQQALKEGWDCSFAYILCSVADIGSARYVEQLLGRVLRLPKARRKTHPELNCAYAMVSSDKFIETLGALKEALIENGFERIEADRFVTAAPDQQGSLPLFDQVSEHVNEKPDLTKLDVSLQNRVLFDDATKTLTVSGEIGVDEKAAIQGCFTTPEARQAVERIYQAVTSRKPPAKPTPPEPVNLRVPGLCIRVNGQLELFAEHHFLDANWNLAECDAKTTDKDFPAVASAGSEGEVDVSKDGKVEVHFVEQLRHQLSLLHAEPGWSLDGLVNWLDRQIPHPDVPRVQSTLFIRNVLAVLMEMRHSTVEELAREKFRLKNSLAAMIEDRRQAMRKTAYNRLLFGPDAADIEVSPDRCLNISEDGYSPNWYYEGGYKFKHNALPVGELKPDGEEFECAVFLDQLDCVKRWVRNIERRPDSSFLLQTSTDRFYPDFVAELQDGRILVVESKGEHLWSNDDSKEKRAVGNLWADRSSGRCLFVMPKGKDWKEIAAVVNGGQSGSNAL